MILSTGCAGTIDGITQRSTRSSVQVAVDELTERATQEKIADNIHEEALTELSRRVAASAVDGALEALEDPDRRARLDTALEGVAIPTGLDRINDAEVSRAVATAIDTAVGRIDRGQARELVHDLVDEAVRTAFASGRDEAARLEMRDQVGALAREVGKQASFGFQDAVEETARRKDNGLVADGEGEVLLAAGQAAKSYSTWTFIAMGGVGALALALLALIIVLHRRGKVARAELEQRDEALVLLTEAVQDTDGAPWSPELRSALGAAMRDRGRRDEVRRMLRERRESRRPPPPETLPGPEILRSMGEAPRSRPRGEGSPPSLRS